MPNEKDETMTTGKEEQERRGRNMIEPVSLLSSLSLSRRASSVQVREKEEKKCPPLCARARSMIIRSKLCVCVCVCVCVCAMLTTDYDE